MDFLIICMGGIFSAFLISCLIGLFIERKPTKKRGATRI